MTDERLHSVFPADSDWNQVRQTVRSEAERLNRWLTGAKALKRRSPPSLDYSAEGDRIFLGLRRRIGNEVQIDERLCRCAACPQLGQQLP